MKSKSSETANHRGEQLELPGLLPREERALQAGRAVLDSAFGPSAKVISREEQAYAMARAMVKALGYDSDAIDRRSAQAKAETGNPVVTDERC